LSAALGREPIDLNGCFKIMSLTPQVLNIDFSSARLELNGKTYPCDGNTDSAPLYGYYYLIAIIPDEAAEGLDIQSRCASFDLKDGKYDALGLRKALSYGYTTSAGYSYERCDYTIKEYSRMERNNTTAIFIIGALYMAVIFVFMSMAILALKTLSGLTEDKQRYKILFRLGAGEKEQGRTLFRQTFSFFFLPFAVPMLLSIPSGVICALIIKLAGFEEQTGEVIATALLIAAVMTAIYVLYFYATYLIAKRNVVCANI
jgi:putative ABC transport system permease protein